MWTKSEKRLPSAAPGELTLPKPPEFRHIHDELWDFFAPFVLGKTSRGGRPPIDHRVVLEAVSWVATSGAPWRELPAEFGNWNSIFRQYRRWSDLGLWDTMIAALEASPETGFSHPQVDRQAYRPASQMAPSPRSSQPKAVLAGSLERAAAQPPFDVQQLKQTIVSFRNVGQRPKFVAERMRRRKAVAVDDKPSRTPESDEGRAGKPRN